MSNITGTSPLLTASLSHYIAERDKILAELDIYLNRPAGTGEHTSISDTVILLFKKLNEAQSTVELIKGIIEDINKEKVGKILTELDNVKQGLTKKNTDNGNSA